MEVSWCFGIVGAVVVLLGTAVLSGDQCRWLDRTFTRMSPRYRAIKSGLGKLHGDPQKPRFLNEKQAGFKEILGVLAERMPRIEPVEDISDIRFGAVAVEDSIAREHVGLRRRTSCPQQFSTIATTDAVEDWLRDARLRALARLGFWIVTLGVVLGLVSLVMQAIASGNC